MIERRTDQAAWRGRPLRIASWSAAAALILLPLVAMQFTDAVRWGPEDFALAVAMVGGVGLVFELALRMNGSKTYLAGVGVALAGGFMLVWSNLAVGIIGSEDNAANLMFFFIPVLSLAGAAIARFRPAGMAVAMTATGLAQIAVAAVAIIGNLVSQTADQPSELIGLTGFFTALWWASAWCFGRAERG